MTSCRIISSKPHLIYASPFRVWAVLVDFPRYGEWNPLNRRVESSLKLGDPVAFWIEDPALSANGTYFEHRLVAFDPPHHLAWEYRNGEVHTRRDQFVEPAGAGTIYRTTDIFFGPLANDMYRRMADPIEKSFNTLAQALKGYAEKMEQFATR